MMHQSVGGRACGAYQVTADPYQRLYNGVIGGVHVGVEREGAFSVAVVSCVTLWRYDPVLVSKATHMSAKGHYGS